MFIKFGFLTPPESYFCCPPVVYLLTCSNVQVYSVHYDMGVVEQAFG